MTVSGGRQTQWANADSCGARVLSLIFLVEIGEYICSSFAFRTGASPNHIDVQQVSKRLPHVLIRITVSSLGCYELPSTSRLSQSYSLQYHNKHRSLNSFTPPLHMSSTHLTCI